MSADIWPADGTFVEGVGLGQGGAGSHLPGLQSVLRRLGDIPVPVDEVDAWPDFLRRVGDVYPELVASLAPLYGSRPDFGTHVENAVLMAARMWLQRPHDLKRLDARREMDPTWYQAAGMMGGVCYVDRFAGSLQGLKGRLPYLRELGLTYLHLMPIFAVPEGNNDGGYAISSYRDVDPALGTFDDLREVAGELRANDISLVLDFVFNHTSDEHEWARRARAGDPEYGEFYFLLEDRAAVDAYQRTLREIFPDQRPGNFTYLPDRKRWVWTTFNSFQWDLNYGNPRVFVRMAEDMLFLANAGAEILRFDALAFIWKRIGTSCESLPEAHLLVRAFNAVARMAAPALVFKSEAIVHPDEVVKYIRPDECRISYNPLLMALLWEALATRQTRLLHRSVSERFPIDARCSWVNYVRSHDDIGWTFDDAVAAQLGINGYDHRQFLNAFYTGRFDGSFARGLLFGENPRTGDARISGTCASLAGLEKGLESGDPREIEHAIHRILLLHAIILSIGGIPLLYLGDEIGAMNDYGYVLDPARAPDSRWVHRPTADEPALERHLRRETVEGRIYSGLTHLIWLRKQTQVLGRGETSFLPAWNEHVFGYLRHEAGSRLVVLANFSEREQSVPLQPIVDAVGSPILHDLVTGRILPPQGPLQLAPYRCVWLVSPPQPSE